MQIRSHNSPAKVLALLVPLDDVPQRDAAHGGVELRFGSNSLVAAERLQERRTGARGENSVDDSTDLSYRLCRILSAGSGRLPR